MKASAYLILAVILFFFISCSRKVNTDKTTKEDTVPAEIKNYSVHSLWTELKPDTYRIPDSAKVRYKRYRLFALDSLLMQTLLSQAPKEKQRFNDSAKAIIELPRPDSGYMRFIIYQTSVMDPALEARYPLLKTYGGQGMNDHTASVRLDFNSNGFHAFITSQIGEWLIQPPAHGITHEFLFCFFKQDIVTRDLKPFDLPDSLKK